MLLLGSVGTSSDGTEATASGGVLSLVGDFDDLLLLLLAPMATISPTDAAIVDLWKKCKVSYSRHGHKLSFPKDTDPRRTYQWRYLASLNRKCQEWEFGEQLISDFISIVVEYSKEKQIIRKGLAVFHQNNVLEICYKTLLQRQKLDNQRSDLIESAHKWLVGQIGGNDPLKTMLQRPKPKAFCNLTIWYEASKLPMLYIALSKLCVRAIKQLQGSTDLQLLPSLSELFMLRQRFYRDSDNLEHARRILGSTLIAPAI